jgi:hypothetical protein
MQNEYNYLIETLLRPSVFRSKTAYFSDSPSSGLLLYSGSSHVHFHASVCSIMDSLLYEDYITLPVSQLAQFCALQALPTGQIFVVPGGRSLLFALCYNSMEYLDGFKCRLLTYHHRKGASRDLLSGFADCDLGKSSSADPHPEV